MQPGKPLAMMIFKCYGYIGMSQALYFLQDLKMGHYMKVPVSPIDTPLLILLNSLTRTIATHHVYSATDRRFLVLHCPGCDL